MLKKATELTMHDIARMAGVSESTVSRALAGSTLVAEKTRARILELASAADYTVNESARNLRQKKSRTIEVIIPIEADSRQNISDPFFLDMLGAIADALTENGYDLLLSKTPPWAEGGRRNALVTGRADGIILIGQGRRRANIRDLVRAHKRVVVWGAQFPEDDYCVVGSDNFEGGRLATAHLVSLGRRRIAFLGDRAQPEIEQRYKGYLSALKEAEIPLDGQLVVTAPFDSEQALRGAQELLAHKQPLDAIVAASDVIAMAANTALRDAEFRIPEDVSVVGYDDIYGAAIFSPALTTVRQNIRLGGEMLVKCLLGLIEEGVPKSVLLPTELIIRNSCGAKK